MKITDNLIKKVIYRLLHSQDYRIEIIALINAEFLQYVIEFFTRVVEAKLKNQSVTIDWYKAEFLNPSLSSDELIIHSGLNKKTISNMYNSARRAIVLEATDLHYGQLYEAINNLVEQGSELDLTLTIKFRGISVDLNINESLIVINTLAVKRAELRGGAWSTTGKQVEKVLMVTLCKLYSVPVQNYKLTGLTEVQREVDFFLISSSGKKHHCEVKLMGKGNPESADATIARDSNVFIADKLSNLNKQQLTGRDVKWIELRSVEGYRKFETVLKELQIPYVHPIGDFDSQLEEIFKEIFV